MADNLNIPAESWRPRRAEPGGGSQIKRLGLFAVGLLGVLALGYGGYSLLSHRPHEVPVVEADPRPLRVRPDNPGGMQLAGADELSGLSGDEAALAPPPEVPAPQALRAEIDAQNRAASTPPALPSPAPPVAAAPPATAAPEQHAPVAAAKVAPHPKPAPPSLATGVFQVQLAALETEQAAVTEWQRLSHRMPDLLGSRQPAVRRAERDGHVFYRLRTGGFPDMAAADAFCAQVRSKGAGCSVATF